MKIIKQNYENDKLYCDYYAFEYPEDIPMIFELNVKLSDYIPKCSGIEYRYKISIFHFIMELL